MTSWKKNRNFRKFANDDGAFTYVIGVDGIAVEVSKEIYEAYSKLGYKMENMEFGLKRDRILKDLNGNAVRDRNGQAVMLPEREISLDKLIDEDWDFESSELTPEGEVVGRFEIDELYECLNSLDADELELVMALFFEGLTESAFATRIGLTQKAINKRKHKVLAKLRKFLLEIGT